MNILDENIDELQRQQLIARRIRVHQIGQDIGRKGFDDREQIIPLLHSLRRSTFFSRDSDFSDRRLCHPRYCLVHLTIEKDEVAEYVRRFLRHPDFNTYAKRLGKVIQVGRDELKYWQLNDPQRHTVAWPRRRRRL